MKAITSRLSIIGALSIIFIFGSGFAPSSAEEAYPPRWERLGKRKVNYGLDRDEMYVTAYEGRFTAVKLMVKRSPVNLHRAVIHFANGTKQEINVRKTLRAGSATRVIDIRGRRRVIKKVVFWYDTKGIQDRKAVIELWGTALE